MKSYPYNLDHYWPNVYKNKNSNRKVRRYAKSV